MNASTVAAKQNVIKHHRMTAQVPQIVVSVLRDRQEKTGRSPGPCQMVEADSGKLGDRNCQNSEIDACDAKTESKKTDEGAGCRSDRHRDEQPKPRPDSKTHE